MENMIKVFDRYGVQRDWMWLVEHYGEVVIHYANPGPGWRVIEMWENADPLTNETTSHTGAYIGIQAAAIIMVQVRGADGLPEEDIPVAWYWPDAPLDPEAGPANGLPAGMIPGRADGPGYTNAEGNVDFAMGPGAYYDPATGNAPHAVWVYGQGTNSDVVFHLGMIAGTNHDSVWPVFMWINDPPIEPPQPPPVDPDPIMYQLEIIRHACDIIEAEIAC